MAVNSASSFAVDPNAYSPGNYSDFYQQYSADNYGITGNQNPYGIGGKWSNFWTGNADAARDAYQLLQDNLQRKYEQDTLQKAREYEMYMSNTAYQRMAADLKAAGLNPWLAVQNGVSGSSNSASATGQSSSYHSPQSSNSGGVSSVLGFLANLAKVAAMIYMSNYAGAAKVAAAEVTRKSINHYYNHKLKG
jgi:hypothetical protein